MSRSNRSRTGLLILMGLALILTGSACTKKDPSSEKIDQLYLELERKYIRAFDKNGYSINYAVKEPNTIVITLHYKPGSAEERLGRDVLRAAETFAKSLAREKYALEIQVRTEDIPITD